MSMLDMNVAYASYGGHGYKGTPGWYTAKGHHHCRKGQRGCVCTDPKKCYRTGYPPGKCQCRPDLGRYGAGPASLCHGGKHGGYYGGPGSNCHASGGSSGGGEYAKGYEAYAPVAYDAYVPIAYDAEVMDDATTTHGWGFMITTMLKRYWILAAVGVVGIWYFFLRKGGRGGRGGSRHRRGRRRR